MPGIQGKFQAESNAYPCYPEIFEKLPSRRKKGSHFGSNSRRKNSSVDENKGKTSPSWSPPLACSPSRGSRWKEGEFDLCPPLGTTRHYAHSPGRRPGLQAGASGLKKIRSRRIRDNSDGRRRLVLGDTHGNLSLRTFRTQSINHRLASVPAALQATPLSSRAPARFAEEAAYLPKLSFGSGISPRKDAQPSAFAGDALFPSRPKSGGDSPRAV